jgi:hypothetical protein
MGQTFKFQKGGVEYSKEAKAKQALVPKAP